MTKATPSPTGKAIVNVRTAWTPGAGSVEGLLVAPVDVSFAKGAGRAELVTVAVAGDKEDIEVENVLGVVE